MTVSRERALINSANASKQGRNAFWNAERFELLKTMAADGAITLDIAAALGNGCTKNMVVGKARREGIELLGNDTYYARLARGAPERNVAAIRRRIAKLQAKLDAVADQEPSRVSRETEAPAA